MSSEPELLGWLIKRIQHRHHKLLDVRMKTLGVSLVQWNALREIARGPELSQRQLAERSFNSDQAFGTLLTRLQAAGLVRRSAVFGRATRHELTERGGELLENGGRVMSEVTGLSFSSLSGAEREQLAGLLTKVLQNST